VSTRAERASSFGSIASDYDRLRPSPAPEAVDWMVPAGCQIAVDLAAGTGKLTRQLATRVPHVVAVEPDPRMREVLAVRSPEVTVLAGTGEQIPLEDAGADALFVASAWHWLDLDRAVPEIARVLADGGRLGVCWTSRDRGVEWVRDLDRGPDDPPWDGAAERDHRAVRRRSLDELPGFGAAQGANFGYDRRMALEDIVAMVATYSAVITAADDVRQRVLDSARTKLQARFPGQIEIDVPTRTWCWRLDRLPR
jgi:SAM-dependent methyltransferase